MSDEMPDIPTIAYILGHLANGSSFSGVDIEALEDDAAIVNLFEAPTGDGWVIHPVTTSVDGSPPDSSCALVVYVLDPSQGGPQMRVVVLSSVGEVIGQAEVP